MALIIGGGGGQNASAQGLQAAQGLLASGQQLQEQRTGEARATAGLELKRMQEEADAMGFSMGRYIERNEERFKGAMATLYGGGRRGRQRAETSYGEVLNGPETKEQLERYTESEWWRENGRGVDWAPEMGTSYDTQSEGGQTTPAPSETAEPSSTYTNDVGDPITEEQYNNQQGVYETALESGDPTAASMIKTEDRESMLAYLEEEASAGNQWAKTKLEQYNDPANADPDNPFASVKQNEIMTSIIRDVNGGQNTRAGGDVDVNAQAQLLSRDQNAFGKAMSDSYGDNPVVMRQLEKIFERVPEENHEQLRRFFVENSRNPSQMQAYDQAFGFEGKTVTEYLRGLMPDESFGGNSLFDPKLWKVPLPQSSGSAAGQPPEMRLRGFNRTEVTPEEESAPTPAPQPMQRGNYFGDVQKFEEDYQQSTGSELNRTNQQLVAARQAQANVKKTEAETSYLRAREDSEYADIELAYNAAVEAINESSLDEIDQKTAIDALNQYDSLVSGLGFPPPQYVDSASLQTYARRLGASGRGDYAGIMGSFADQVENNPALQDYFEVRTVYTTSGSEDRAEAGTPSGRDVARDRKVRLVVPRSRGRAGTTQSELGDRLVSETEG